MKLSIIIPVFNEESTVGQLLKKVKKVKLPQGLTREIIVVDDGSTDSTRSILQKESGIKVFKHKKNQGKGAAIRLGLLKSKGEIILIQDADLEYNPDDYPRLLKPIINGEAQVVYGSRLSNYPLLLSGKSKTPLVTHYFGNKLLTFVTNVLYGSGLTDMETCYKVFKKEVVKEMKLKAENFDFEPEFTAKVLKREYKIFEIPIKVKPRGYDEGKKISWKDGFIALWTLIKYKFIE